MVFFLNNGDASVVFGDSGVVTGVRINEVPSVVIFNGTLGDMPRSSKIGRSITKA